MLATQWAYSLTSATLRMPFHTGTKGGRKLSGMWRSTFKNRSYIRYGLQVRARSFGIVRYTVALNVDYVMFNKHVTKLTLRQLMFVNM